MLSDAFAIDTAREWPRKRWLRAFIMHACCGGAQWRRGGLTARRVRRHEQNRGKTWQRCPRCDLEAWKADAQCNRVVCKEACGTNFCFLCGEDITKQQYLHFWNPWHPCHLKTWHMPLAGEGTRPACTCGSCRKR